MANTFTDIKAWQLAHQFTLSVYAATKSFPECERYGLTSQFQRAAVSIPANIAEGFKRATKAEKLRFINIAQGSLEECRYYIILTKDLYYLNNVIANNLCEMIENVSRCINAYAKAIKEDIKNAKTAKSLPSSAAIPSNEVITSSAAITSNEVIPSSAVIPSNAVIPSSVAITSNEVIPSSAAITSKIN